MPYHIIATFSAHRHLNRMDIGPRGALHVINGTMMGDHSDNLGPKNDGIGHRWVSITTKQIATTWVRVGFSGISRRASDNVEGSGSSEYWAGNFPALVGMRRGLGQHERRRSDLTRHEAITARRPCRGHPATVCD